MVDLYNGIKSVDGNKTLYYAATPTAAPLKCYTVKDLSWDYVFGSETVGEATSYSAEFKAGYQQDDKSIDNGIKTALLKNDKFGSD